MNVQTDIDKNLWEAIESTFNSGHYSHAILGAMQFLSDVIRERTGLSGDGVALVGEAFGGEEPRLRLNRLQTRSEKDVQKGIEQILRGLYLSIRNPRSHEQIEDSKQTAETIIFFIDYLLSLISESKERFTLDGFCARVFDPDFVESERYAFLLIDEIPENKYLDVAVEIYRRRAEGNRKKLEYFFPSLLKKLPPSLQKDIMNTISADLRTQQDENLLITTLCILPDEYWPKLSEAARLRIENKLIKSISKGLVNSKWPHSIKEGALGTWATGIHKHFTLKNELSSALRDKMKSWIPGEKYYVARYFFSILPEMYSDQGKFVKTIAAAIRENDSVIREELLKWIDTFPESLQQQFVTSLQDQTDEENPAHYLLDGTPFLKAEDEDYIPEIEG